MAAEIATDVLIIEDETFIAMDLESLVKNLGHNVIGVARTHSDAVALAKNRKPGLILADIQLADGSSGLDAVNELLKTFEVPVVFITAYPERFLTGERPEPAFLISKPFQPAMVSAVASQALFFQRNSRNRAPRAAATWREPRWEVDGICLAPTGPVETAHFFGAAPASGMPGTRVALCVTGMRSTAASSHVVRPARQRSTASSRMLCRRLASSRPELAPEDPAAASHDSLRIDRASIAHPTAFNAPRHAPHDIGRASRLLSGDHGCNPPQPVDRLPLPCRDRLRLGAQLAVDEAAAAGMAAAVLPRPCRRRCRAHPRLYRLGRGQSLAVPREAIPRLLFASFTNVFAWMGFGTMAMNYVTVGEGALVAYTMPIWAMLLAWPFLHARPTVRDVAPSCSASPAWRCCWGRTALRSASGKLIGIALALSCAILFALGNVLNRSAVPDAAAGGGRLAGRARLPGDAGPWHRLRAVRTMPRSRPLGIACFVYMTLVPMGVCYLTWFETLRRLPPASASTGMLLVPVIGVVSAALILGEPLGLREVAAMVLTLGGVTLALRKG